MPKIKRADGKVLNIVKKTIKVKVPKSPKSNYTRSSRNVA
jgi:hypothetical protein